MDSFERFEKVLGMGPRVIPWNFE